MYVCVYIYIYIHITSYKTTPTPTYRSGVKKITLFTPEGKNVQAHFWKLREGHVTTQNLQSDVSVQSLWVANCFPPCVMAFVTEMFICTKPVLHLL